MVTSLLHPRQTRRILWLDTLRGLASLSVVFGHCIIEHFPKLALEPFNFGVFGVGVFFFVSGYIIPQSVATTQDVKLFHFLTNRAFRILPVYWIAILFGAVIYHSTLKNTLVNLTGASPFLGVENIVGVIWTLQVEFVFYCWVALAIYLDRLRDLRFVLTAIGVSLALSVACGAVRYFIGRKAPVALPVGMAFILLGYWVFLFRSGLVAKALYVRVWTLSGACLLATFYLAYSRDWGFDETPWRFVVSYGLATVLFLVVSGSRPVVSRTMVVVASFSYPLYLLHQPMRTLFQGLLPHLSPLAADAVAFVLVVPLSALAHVVIENPCIRCGKKLAANPPQMLMAAGLR